MTITILLDLITALLLVVGGFFAFAAALGVLRLPDILIRMHASTKAATLGAGMILVAVALHFHVLSVTSRAVATIIFLLVTAPVAAHMIGRAAYRSRVPLWEKTVVDQLAEARRREGGEAS